MQYLRHFKKEWIYEKYVVFKNVSSRNCFARHKKPKFFENLFSVVFVSYFQETFLSNTTPKNFMDGVFSITWFHIFNVGNYKGILSLIEYLWNNVCFVFFIFNDNLFALNHWLIFLVHNLLFYKEFLFNGGNKKGLCCLQHHWV